MRLNRVVPAVAATVLSLGLLAGCGDKDVAASGSSSSSAPDAVPASALTQGTFASSITSAMQKAGSAHLSMKGAVGGQELSAEGDQNIGSSPKDSQLAMKMQVIGQEFEIRLIDQVVYFNLGALSQDKFAKIDLNDTSNPLVAQFGGLATDADVTAQFDSFKDAISGFEKSGEPQTIDGVEAQPYKVTVDTKKLTEAAGKDAVAGMPDTLDYTFFVGTDNLPRRMVVSVQGSDLTLDYSDWGKAVKVEKPAAGDITDVDLSQLGGAGA